MAGTALVTGASSGIGEACVRALTAAGWRVLAMARRAEPLQALCSDTGATPLIADVRDTDAVAAVLQGQAVDLLVNNAGLGAGMSGLVGASAEDLERTIDTNVRALLDVTRQVLPGMTARHRGHVVNLGSVAGLYPINSAVYGGSKGAVHLISQNLRLELRGTGIRVSEICPARVATEFFQVAIGKDVEVPITILSPEDIAEAVMFAVEAPDHVNVSMIEIQPVEQSFGAIHFDALEPAP
ncbi:MAG: SDR family oxidoreductase [Pseudomonadota bacterium]